MSKPAILFLLGTLGTGGDGQSWPPGYWQLGFGTLFLLGTLGTGGDGESWPPGYWQLGLGTLFLLGTLAANPGHQAIGSWAYVPFSFLSTLGTGGEADPGHQTIGSWA